MTADQRMRWLIKPAVFTACLLPAAWYAYAAVTDGLGANPIEALNRGLGDWALRFLLIALAVTPVRQISGWNGLARLRRMLGLFAFFYVTMHVSSYVILDHFFAWKTIWEDILKRTYITVGMLGVLLLLPLAVTSTQGWIRRLGKLWQTLHRAAYIAGIAGVVHFYMMVKADVREPLIYGGILAMLLGWRAVRALRRRNGRRAARPQAALTPFSALPLGGACYRGCGDELGIGEGFFIAPASPTHRCIAFSRMLCRRDRSARIW